jgi:hypothetical protein
MIFSTFEDVNQFVSARLAHELAGRRVAFVPVSDIPHADCGSDIFLQLAQLRNQDPQQLGEALVAQGGFSESFTVSHGFLNFYGGLERSWLLTQEPALHHLRPFAAQRLGVLAPDFDLLGAHAVSTIRIRSMLLFQLYLLLFVEAGDAHQAIELMIEHRSLQVTRNNFTAVAQEFLTAEKVSVPPAAIERGAPMFLHVSPKGMSKHVYTQFIASERSEAPWLKFLARERVFYQAPTLPWSPHYVERTFQRPEWMTASLFYLSSALQATELDDTVVFNHENANLWWLMQKTIDRVSRLHITAPSDMSLVSLSSDNRAELLRIKFFHRYLFEAKYHGKVSDLIQMLNAVLRFAEYQLNHPNVRRLLELGELPADTAYILAGATKQLELFYS